MKKKSKNSPYSQSGQAEYAKRLRTNAWKAGSSFAKLKKNWTENAKEKHTTGDTTELVDVSPGYDFWRKKG